jgi:hypothetical protein
MRCSLLRSSFEAAHEVDHILEPIIREVRDLSEEFPSSVASLDRGDISPFEVLSLTGQKSNAP